MIAKTNKAQRASIYRKWQQNNQGMTYREFRKTVQQGFDCLMVQWSGMWLGIESDGYTHS
jgi:hypothetical protein